jgi:hypothetical protein
MLGEDVVRPSEAFVEVVVQHGARAIDGLFGGLTDQHQRAMPTALLRRHALGKSEQHGHVDVVPAGVHDAHVCALGIGGSGVTRVLEAGLFLDRQPIHVGAHQQSLARTILQDGDEAVRLRFVPIAAHALGDFVAELAQICSQLRGGLALLVRQLGVAVQVLVGIEQRRHQRVHSRIFLLGREWQAGECVERCEQKGSQSDHAADHYRGSLAGRAKFWDVRSRAARYLPPCAVSLTSMLPRVAFEYGQVR